MKLKKYDPSNRTLNYDWMSFQNILNAGRVFDREVQKIVDQPNWEPTKDSYLGFKETIEEQRNLISGQWTAKDPEEFFKNLRDRKDVWYQALHIINSAKKHGIKLLPETLNIDEMMPGDRMAILRALDIETELPQIQIDTYDIDRDVKLQDAIAAGRIKEGQEPMTVIEGPFGDTYVYENLLHGEVISTIGSKDIVRLWNVPDFRQRFIDEFLEKLQKAGYQVKKTSDLVELTPEAAERNAKVSDRIGMLLRRINGYNRNYVNSLNVQKQFNKYLMEIRNDKIRHYQNMSILNKLEKYDRFTYENYRDIVTNLQYNIRLLKQGYESRDKFEQETGDKQVLDPTMDLNYFTPLVHHLIQTHIARHGKNVPLIFSGYQITSLTQGSSKTAAIYAGPEEVSRGFAKKVGPLWSMMNKIPGIELRYKENLEGFVKVEDPTDLYQNMPGINPQQAANALRDAGMLPTTKYGKPGGYVVDLTNYNYEAPLLFSLKKNIKKDDNTQLDMFEGQEVDIQQRATPGSPAETSVMTQATLNDRSDNTVEPQTTEHVAALELAQKMSDMLGIPYQTVTAEQAAALTAQAKNPWQAGDLAFFVGGRVYFVGNNLSMENVFHEFAHPFVRHLTMTNPKLINRLFDQLVDTEQGQEIIREVRALYPDMDASMDLFKEEAIVKALTISGMDKLNKLQSQPKFQKVINNILYAIKQAIRKIFGKTPISGLTAATTMQELADILVEGGKIQLDVESISQDDIVAYNKDRSKFIEEMNNVPEGMVQRTINDFAEITVDHINTLIRNKNYDALADVLNVREQGELQQIRANLGTYRSDLVKMANKTAKDITDITERSTALVNSLFRLDMVMDKINEHVKDIQKEGETIDNLHKGYYYKHLIDQWENFVKEVQRGLTRNGIDRDSPLVSLLAQITTSIDQSKDIINEMFAVGARDVLYDQLLPMHQNIKAKYDARIERLKKLPNVPQARIDREYKEYYGVTQAQHARLRELRALAKSTTLTRQDQNELNNLEIAEFNGVAISPEKIERILKEGITDANFFNSYLEAYLYNTDPVIGGLAAYVKNHLNNVQATAQGKYNTFAKDVQPKLKKAGINMLRPGDLGKKVGFKDKVGKLENGKIIMREVWAFLNPFKDIRYDAAVYDQAVTDAVNEYSRTESEEHKQAMIKAIADRKQFQRDYMNQQFTDVYYDAEDILYQGEGDTIGEEAIYRKERWAEELRTLTEPANTPSEQLAIADELNNLWRKYRQLRSRYYLNGDLKVDDPEKGIYDASVAERLRQHYEATRDFYEWRPRKNAFQNALQDYEQELTDAGIKGAEFDALRQTWIDKNTVKVPVEEYYASQKRDYDRMAEIYKKLPKTEKEKLDESIIMQQIFDLTQGFKDDEGQIKANEMELGARLRVKELEEELDRMRKRSAKTNGLTQEQNDRLNELRELKAQGTWNAQMGSEQNMLYGLMETYGLSKFELMELENIKARLAGISKREATDYYVDTMNTWLDQLNVTDPTIKQIDKQSADWLLEPARINQLLGQNKDFDKWFDDNHIMKKVWQKGKPGQKAKQVDTYVRTKVWSITVPTDNSMYETISLYDAEGNPTEIIEGKPILKYFTRAVKPEYRNERIEGVTVDNKGKWLPKTMQQGAKDNKYVNERYFEMQKNDPDMFAALEVLKKHHLKNQEGLSNRSKLYMDYPRFRKSNLELLQDQNLLTNLVGRVKDWFQGAKDDAEDEYNFSDENDLISLDLYDNRITKVPIHGLYDVDIDDVSTDITHTMMQYMLSAERQKQLVEISPVVRAIQSVVTAEAQNRSDTEGIDNINKQNMYNRAMRVFKGDAVRKKAVDNFIEREFEGQRMTGAGSDSPWLNNTASLLFKRASFGFFAFNIPSALKNSYGAKFQGLIEASAGEYMTHISFQKGNAWSYATMAELSFGGQLYQKGPKSLNQQKVELFDPSQGRFEENIGEGLSRTIAKDAASFSWLYNFRKWVELQATLQIFGGMMYHQMVEQTMSDGTTREIPYMDAWELRDEQIQLKEGIDPKWGITYDETGKATVGAEFNKYKNKVHQVMNNLQGAYAKFDQPEAQRYLVFRFLSYLRRYFTTMTLNRFGFSGRWTDPQPRLNPGLGDVQMGFYITFLRFAKDTIVRGGRNLMYMTDVEKQATLKIITEMGLLLATSLAMSLLFGWDPDDDEKYEKLRARSGALPFPMTADDPDRPFNAWGFTENHMLYLLMNIRAENEQFLPIPGYGLDDYSALLDLKSIAFGPTVQTYKDIFEDALDILEGNETAKYKRKVGPYEWQQEGGHKIFAHIGRTVGLTGSSLDAAKGIKGFQSVQARAR
jgi:hypothetical protein